MFCFGRSRPGVRERGAQWTVTLVTKSVILLLQVCSCSWTELLQVQSLAWRPQCPPRFIVLSHNRVFTLFIEAFFFWFSRLFLFWLFLLCFGIFFFFWKSLKLHLEWGYVHLHRDISVGLKICFLLQPTYFSLGNTSNNHQTNRNDEHFKQSLRLLKRICPINYIMLLVLMF